VTFSQQEERYSTSGPKVMRTYALSACESARTIFIESRVPQQTLGHHSYIDTS